MFRILFIHQCRGVFRHSPGAFLLQWLPFMRCLFTPIFWRSFLFVLLSTTAAWAAEKNPPGDIPDDQVFVSYTSSVGGYSLKVPEGWARTEKGADVGFIEKFDGVSVAVVDTTSAPTAKDVVSRLQKSDGTIKVTSTKEIQLQAGQAILVKYESDSEANPVTNKRIRLENEAYVFYKDGKIATLALWAPKGADNADQWKLMSESFRW